jgi:lipopolysaccharide export system permease protein
MINILYFFYFRRWFTSFFSFFIGLNLIAFLGDFVNNVLRNKYTLQDIFHQYFLGITDIFEKIFPVSCLLATLFTINKLKQHSELIAIFSLGFKKRNLIILTLGFSLLIAAIQFYNLGFLRSYLLQTKNEVEKKFQPKKSGISKERIWVKNKNYFMSYGFVDKKRKIISDPKIYFFNDDFHLESILRSSTARYGGNKLWNFYHAVSIKKLDGQSFPIFKKVYLEPVHLREDLADFVKFQSNILSLNIFALGQFVNALKDSGLNLTEYKISIYNRISMTVSCVVFAILPLTLLGDINRRSQNTNQLFVYSFVFFVSFWLAHGFALKLAEDGVLTPLLASFLIPLFMIGYSAFQFKKQHRL